MQIKDKQALVNTVPWWFHSIDVQDSITTVGRKSSQQLQHEWQSFRIPDLRGKSVLDINTWDGYFAFAAEEAGAASVTALDSYIWSFDLPGLHAYIDACKRQHIVPKQYHETEFYHPDQMPGMRGFNVARQLRNSHVCPLIADFMKTDLSLLGTFDVTFFFGSLYHMENPLEPLRRLAAVTKEVAVIETEAIVVPGYEQHALCEFFESNELAYDVSNWWAPNHKALTGMCRAAGFRRVELLVDLPESLGLPRAVHRFRAVAQAWK